LSIRKLNPISRKALALTLATLLAAAPSAHYAQAQDLDDAIDAELDEVAGGDAPSTEPESGKTTKKPAPAAGSSAAAADSLDDIQLDDGDTTETASKPEAEAPKDDVDVELDETETASEPETPKSDDPVIDDALDLDDDTKVAEPADTPKTDDLDDPVDGSTDPEIADVEETKPEVAPEQPVQRKRPVVIDAPNDAYEKKLARISNGYKQVPDISWEEIVGDRRQENYGIQRGDTLWDISETFFGDGFFWAKLWSQNGVIGNPHMIVRGKAIRFVAGTESDAPAIGVMDTLVASNQEIVSVNPLRETVNERPTYREQVENDITPEEVESGVVLETDELIPAPDLPAASRRTKTLKELPASFRPPVAAQYIEGYDASGIKGAPSIRARVPATTILNSMIFDRTPDVLGKVDEIESQERVAHQGQGVYIRLNKEVAAGTKVTFGRVRARPSGASGPVIDIQGIGVVSSSVNEGRNAYRATVITSLQPVEKGVAVYEFAPPTVTYVRDGRRNEAQVTVVGGEYDDKRRLVGAGSVIYLAGGSNVDLRVGDIMGVQAVRGERRPTSYPKVKTPIAIIRIADVREKVATAVVLTSVAPIQIGDRTGGEVPDALPSLRSETAEDLTRGFSANTLMQEEAPSKASTSAPPAGEPDEPAMDDPSDGADDLDVDLE
jgi:nucleoid-associated protein YgaU